MKHYGTTPPWEGRSPFGYWSKGGELWEGGFEWNLILNRPGGGATLVSMASLLKEFYISPVRAQLEKSSVLAKVITANPLPLSRAGQHAKWKRLPWWRRLYTPRPR